MSPPVLFATILILAISMNLDGARNRVTPIPWRAQSAPSEGQAGDRGLWKIGSESVEDSFAEVGWREGKAP